MTTTLTRPFDVETIEPSPRRVDRHLGAWAVLITGLALFMASLDNLVVTTALPAIRVHLHAGLSGLEWTVNAYTLTFAVFLLTAAAFGERFGRRRTFIDRRRHLHHGLGSCRPLTQRGFPHRRAGHPGRRRRDDHAAVAHLAQRRRQAGASQRRARHLGRHRRRGHRARPTRRRSSDDRLVVALHLLAERAHRDRARAPGVVEARRIPGYVTSLGHPRGAPRQRRALRRGPRSRSR